MLDWFRKPPGAFKFAPGADIDNTSRQAEVSVPTQRMVEMFGPPGESNGDKVSDC